MRRNRKKEFMVEGLGCDPCILLFDGIKYTLSSRKYINVCAVNSVGHKKIILYIN